MISDDATWTRIADVMPVENVPVLTKIHDHNGPRNEQVLVRFGKLWFHEDKAMYVYYTPTHWKNTNTTPMGFL